MIKTFLKLIQDFLMLHESKVNNFVNNWPRISKILIELGKHKRNKDKDIKNIVEEYENTGLIYITTIL